MSEEQRKLLMQLCSLFEEVMVEKDGVASYWKYDFDLEKLVRIKNNPNT